MASGKGKTDIVLLLLGVGSMACALPRTAAGQAHQPPNRCRSLQIETHQTAPPSDPRLAVSISLCEEYGPTPDSPPPAEYDLAEKTRWITNSPSPSANRPKPTAAARLILTAPKQSPPAAHSIL